jgi:hypothetical protein
MEQRKQDIRWFRVIVALVLGLLLLSMLLPNTGAIIAGAPPDPKMWRCGPFLFFPDSLFGVVVGVSIVTACTVFGIMRRNACELIGWVLFCVIIFLMFLT